MTGEKKLHKMAFFSLLVCIGHNSSLRDVPFLIVMFACVHKKNITLQLLLFPKSKSLSKFSSIAVFSFIKVDKHNVTKCQHGCEALVKEIDHGDQRIGCLTTATSRQCLLQLS